jgi:hypothetical protein
MIYRLQTSLMLISWGLMIGYILGRSAPNFGFLLITVYTLTIILSMILTSIFKINEKRESVGK